jgi:type II secretory pathway component PulF
MGDARIGVKPLSALCRRLATSLGAGVDVRTVWAREALSARGSARRRFADISQMIDAGATISDAMKVTGKYFPEFFRALVKVGEESGHLPEVFRQLAEHYEHYLRLRRTFLAAITWPVIELLLALTVIGALIWVMGVIPTGGNERVDMLGLGLMGNQGLAIYLLSLAGLAGCGALVYRAATRGMMWVAPIQHLLMRVPQLGSALRTISLARLAWAMHVTLNSGMNLRPAMKMALASTHNVVYTRHTDRVLASIAAGNEVHEALAATGAFPFEFVESVRVGEESGRLVESMAHLADEYQDQARLAMNTLSILMGMAVAMLIGGVIIFAIYQIFTRAYLGPINDALHFKI